MKSVSIKCVCLFIIFVIPFSLAQGQYLKDISIEAVGALGQSQTQVGVGIQKLHSVGNKFFKENKLKIGYGLRFSTYSGSGQYFETAPASIRVNKSIDNLYLEKSVVSALNVAFYVQYSVTPKIELGFNIDVLGVSFGKQQQGVFIFQPLGTSVYAKPTGFNALLIGNNDRGTLSSEFFARYWISKKVALKGGYNYFFVEYTTTQKLTFENDRFRNKAPMGFVGVTYKLF